MPHQYQDPMTQALAAADPLMAEAGSALKQAAGGMGYEAGAAMLSPLNAGQAQADNLPGQGVIDPNYEGDRNLDHSRLPYDNKWPRNWDAQKILGSWSQIDAHRDLNKDRWMCGPTSALALAILAGPKAVYEYSRKLSDTAKFNVDAMRPNPGKESDPEEVSQYLQAFAKYGEALFAFAAGADCFFGTATYETLGKLADYAAVVHNMGDGTSRPEQWDNLKQMTKNGGRVNEVTTEDEDGKKKDHKVSFKESISDGTAAAEGHRTLKKWAKFMVQPGMGCTIIVEFEEATPNAHYVSMGSDPSGDVFLYDPYPRLQDQGGNGKQLMTLDDADALSIFLKADGTFRFVERSPIIIVNS